MGQGESSDSLSVSPFSSKEKENVKELFKKIAVGNTTFNEENLKRYMKSGFPESLVGSLFRAIVKVSSEQRRGKSTKTDGINLHRFMVAMASISRGTLAEKAEVVVCMASENPAVTPQDILQWTKVMLQAYVSQASNTPQYSSWKFDASDDTRLATVAFAIVRDLFYKAKDKSRHQDEIPTNTNFDAGMLEDWMSKSAVVLHILDVVLSAIFPVNNVEGATPDSTSHLLPSCSLIDWNSTQSLLSQFDVLLLNFNLPIQLNKEWRLIFHTGAHGESFATFFKNICHKGPTIVMVKDKDGHVFGGFASQSWEPNPNFVGSSRCFLFSLLPHTEVYLASGLNENYMYLNSMQETLPNGLGMGGQFDYYGFYIDDEFGKGCSCAEPYCSTYDSPQLSRSRQFEIDTLEVWAVGPEPSLDENEDNEKRSILDKDPEAKAMLQIINKGPLSEGLREGDPMAEQPEQTSFHN